MFRHFVILTVTGLVFLTMIFGIQSAMGHDDGDAGHDIVGGHTHQLTEHRHEDGVTHDHPLDIVIVGGLEVSEVATHRLEPSAGLTENEKLLFDSFIDAGNGEEANWHAHPETGHIGYHRKDVGNHPHPWDPAPTFVSTNQGQPSQLSQPSQPSQPSGNQPAPAQTTSTEPAQGTQDSQPSQPSQPTRQQSTRVEPIQTTPAGTEPPSQPPPIPETTPAVSDTIAVNLDPIQVTEYMIKDWSTAGGGGLPQWVELYNPNPDSVNLDGWTFQYAARDALNDPLEIRDVTISEATIAPESTLLLVTRRILLSTDSAIEESQIYNLEIENVLKRGWRLISADDEVIHQIGTVFDHYADPVAPPHQDGARVSHHVIESVAPSDSYYYGSWRDIGSPGFHKPPMPSAPALIKPKKVGVWADLKRRAEK